jgi:hypothetical protein
VRVVAHEGDHHVIQPLGIASREAFGTPRIQMASNLWMHWFAIAVAHAAAASAARQRAVAAATTDRP